MMESVTTMRSLEMHAESKISIEGWVAYSCEVKDSPYGKYFEVCGAVCPLYTKGNKKGRPNYSKADKSTQKSIAFTPKEHDEFVSKWETENSKCMMCDGKGEFARAWSVEKGAYNYKSCDRCNGIGKIILEAIKGE